MRRPILLVVVVSLSLAGCRNRKSTPAGDDDDDGTGCAGAVISLAPASLNLTLDGGTPAPISFVATDGDGHVIHPAGLTWQVSRADDTPPGTIANGVFAPFPNAGGAVTVRASDACTAGLANVSLFLDVTVGTPSDPGAWAGTPDTGGTPATVVYPSDQTRFPRNIHQTLFQWRTEGYTQFRLTFEGASSKVTVFTDGAHAQCTAATPAAGCWEADANGWSYLAGSNAGGTAAWTLDALDTSTIPATVRRSPPITIGFSKRDVKGAIFYWSTTSAGIRRAAIGAAAPEDYLAGNPETVYPPPDADSVKCVACHTVSRDGRYIAAPIDATSGKSLWVLEVTAQGPPTPLVKSFANTDGKGFATFSPDDATLALAWSGDLWTVDRITGAYGAAIATAPYNGVTHPDWSPDGTQLVVATAQGDSPANASLALIPSMAGGLWGAPVELVASAGASNLFPMFSPDGNFVAYSRGAGGHGDETSQLWVVGAVAGATPVELVNANRVVSNQLGDGQHENNLPTWAPPGDLAWIAFNSLREYGVVQQQGTQQIWVAAVDPAALAAGTVDPSFPAFRLQFQGLNEDNHRAFWTLDINQDDPGDPDD